MPEPTPRQVLYALVAGGFHVVAGLLAAASAPLAPAWWTIGFATVWLAVAVFVGLRWRRTGTVLALSIATFVSWTIGAAILLT